MTFPGVCKMRMAWLGHSYFGGRKKDMDVAARKGRDFEQVNRREGDDAVIKKVEWKDVQKND